MTSEVRNTPASSARPSFWTVFYLLVAFGIVVPWLASGIFPDPVVSDADLVNTRKITPLAAKVRLHALLQKQPHRTDLWYGYVNAHFRQKPGDRSDDAFWKDLMTWETDDDPELIDNLEYARGLFKVSKKELDEGLRQYRRVRRQDRPYLQNSIGYALLAGQRKIRDEQGPESVDRKTLEKAAEAFRKEIGLKGNIAGAYGNLGLCHLLARQYEEIISLSRSPESASHISRGVVRIAAFNTGEWGTYLRSALAESFSVIRPASLLTGIVSLLFWIGFIRRVDIFEPEPWWALGMTFCLGLVTTLFLFLPHDLLVEGAGLRRWDAGGPNLLAYLVIVVGGCEEFVKIVPLLLMMRFSRQVNESVDILVYALTSALAFAFLENLQYSAYGPATIFHRTFTATVAHMAMSCLAAYGFFLARLPGSGLRPWLPHVTFLMAAVLHGTYDYFLLEKKLEFLAPITSMACLFLLYRVMRITLTNALNQSEFYSERAAANLSGLFRYIVLGMLGLYTWTYMTAAFQYGPSVARLEIGIPGMLEFLVPWLFGSYVLRRRKWESWLSSKSPQTD